MSRASASSAMPMRGNWPCQILQILVGFFERGQFLASRQLNKVNPERRFYRAGNVTRLQECKGGFLEGFRDRRRIGDGSDVSSSAGGHQIFGMVSRQFREIGALVELLSKRFRPHEGVHGISWRARMANHDVRYLDIRDGGLAFVYRQHMVPEAGPEYRGKPPNGVCRT